MSETAIHLSASARLVAGALAEASEVTVVELTALAAVSKSTVAKTLTVLERAGAACRKVREADGIREADLWSPGPGLGELLFGVAAGDSGEEEELVRPSGDSAGAGSQQPNMVKEVAEQQVSEASVGTDDGGLGAETTDERPVLSEAEQPAAVDPVADRRSASAEAPGDGQVAERRERLAPGALAELVHAAMSPHPDIAYTPTMLSHLLGGRSAGAIQNVLEKMRAAGTAVRVCDKPKRYRYVGADARSVGGDARADLA